MNERRCTPMMNMFFVIVLVLWIYILTVLKRGKLDFWYFITGSIGLFAHQD